MKDKQLKMNSNNKQVKMNTKNKVKMNIKKFFTMAAMTAAVTMTSCNNDEAVVNNTDRNAVQFASTGTEALQTRVDGANWDGGEIIGIYMVENSTTNVAESAKNIQYVNSASQGANATFSPFMGAPIYYPVTTPAKVDFIAYYPYQPALTNWKYSVNVATQVSQSGIDLLWTKEDNSGNGYDKTHAAPVNLAFTHQLTKLSLTVQPGTDVTLANLAVRIKGMNTTADFDVKTAGFTNEGDAKDITPYNAVNNEYEAILLPVLTLGTGHSITFTTDSGVYTWNLSGAGGITGDKLESGKKYAYTVTLNKHALSVTGTIVDWGIGEAGGSVTAN